MPDNAASRSPIVAVSATSSIVDGRPRVRVNVSYVRALEGAGLVPLVVPPLATPEHAERMLEAVDGLLLTGGEDVDPSHYGADPHPELGTVHDDRDATELALVRGARRRRIPTLAICRGVQLLNVALGGTLVQHIPDALDDALEHDLEAERHARTHEVRVDSGSRLGDALGDEDIRVNSFHHQALDHVADSLRVTARAPDGIVEGVETAGDDWWAVGVQWHPEELLDTEEPWDRNLFDAFGDAMRRRLK